MANLFSFILCDNLNNFQQGPNGPIPMLISPQLALRPPFIPGTFSFGMAVGINDVNVHTPNKMKVTIKTPDGKVIYDSGETELPFSPDEDTSLPTEYQGFMMNIDIRNLPIEKEGAYYFTFLVNGKEVGTKLVPIYKKGQ